MDVTTTFPGESGPSTVISIVRNRMVPPASGTIDAAKHQPQVRNSARLQGLPPTIHHKPKLPPDLRPKETNPKEDSHRQPPSGTLLSTHSNLTHTNHKTRILRHTSKRTPIQITMMTQTRTPIQPRKRKRTKATRPSASTVRTC